MKKIIALLLLAATPGIASAQQPASLTLDLERVVALANDSSLEAFRAQNMYLAGYWAYRTYKANRLPSLTLNLTPAQYNRHITQRYDSENNIDVYRSQQAFSAYGELSVQQNFDLTGGTFFLATSLAYMRNSGSDATTQFSSVPVSIGYSQSLIGYNAFKWDRRIEPLKYERAKKEFLYNVAQVSETATTYFFTLASAQTEYRMAKENLASADTLYRIGQERQKIASISRADLLTLRLDWVNARNTLQNKASDLKRAMFSLATFLNLDKHTQIDITLPSRPANMEVPVDEALRWAHANNPRILQLRQEIMEARQNVDRTKWEARFNASLSASIGFNQVADNFRGAYRNPLRQDVVSVSLSIPLIDWGVRKGRHNVARSNLNVAEISSRQETNSIEEEVIMAVSDFNNQRQLLGSAEEALDLSIMAYDQTRQRFIIGKADISSLTLSLNRQQEAQRNYIAALQKYWQDYYRIRRLTLYDFGLKTTLSDKFDFTGGTLR
ncbi:MAG: TolC family protein [Mediterranea sp.]|jgi:outer membrane protein TolC|nr:TolC family protein [Mediterranea sp.]